MTYDSLVNRNSYFSAHYLAEVLPKDLKKGLFVRWTELEKQERDEDGPATPRSGLKGLRKRYFKDRAFFAEYLEGSRAGEVRRDKEKADWSAGIHDLNRSVVTALGFKGEPRTLTVERADKEYEVPVAYAGPQDKPSVIAIECGWAPDVDAALDPEQAGLLLSPVKLDNNEEITTGEKLATWLFTTDEPPRYVLILCGGVVILADRATWSEGRYLAASLDVALGRSNAMPGEIDTIAALFGADSLLPPEEGGTEPLAELLTGSRQHAVGVSKELRDGLRESVEIIANEVLDRIREAGYRPEQIDDPADLAKSLGRQSLRYLYRILFLLYAEARPELGVLPADDEAYVKGYSMARLGDLVVRDLVSEESRRGFHLYDSLDLLFTMVNTGHNARGGASAEGLSEGEGLRFEPLRADLFDPERTSLIGEILLDEDEPNAPRIDTRLRNEVLYRVLRLLMIAKGKGKQRGGFISYAQLGINQLGAVYEGLMSYTGFIAQEELYEVAKNGDPSDGSWMIPASKVDDYEDAVFVRRIDEHGFKTDDRVTYKPGAFVYRLAGRDRQTSASYYTPESLTQVTVQLALRELLDQDGRTTTAREILDWTICEPALGSGAFLNEAINQVAAEYLKRRQNELGVQLEPEQYTNELQKVKAYIALHRAYGVDLNETAVELAEVSLWLNVMYPGLQAPWFGLHLRRGNSLIGAGRRTYAAHQLKKKAWLTTAPDERPFRDGPIPDGHVHHFLLPAQGWGAVAGEKEAKQLAPEQAKQLADWRKAMLKDPTDKTKKSQLRRLQGLSRRAEYLWDLVIKRLQISEREISRHIDVWGAENLPHPKEAVPREKILADLTTPGTPYWRLKTLMDTWCALWFWPLDKAGLLDGSDEVYQRLKGDVLDSIPGQALAELKQANLLDEPTAQQTNLFASEVEEGQAESGRAFPQSWIEPSLFGESPVQEELAAPLVQSARSRSKTKMGRKPQIVVERRSVIPLADLDDWLDFAEAVLGVVEITEDTLFPEFDSLAKLDEHENELAAWMGMDSENRLEDRFPWFKGVVEIAREQGFFHWDLQFAQVFQRGGFNIQVGNPPWVRLDWQEDVTLAEYNPWFKLTEKPSAENWRDRKKELLGVEVKRRSFLDELVINAGMATFVTAAISYPLMVGTRPDLYRVFMCLAWQNIDSNGIAALIHPDTHFGGVKEGRLRASAYRHLRIHGHFHNRRGIFSEIHANIEFGIHIYGVEREINFKHLSWLFDPAVLIDSLDHDGAGDAPGIKYEGKWDIRPHRDRVIKVDKRLLAQWRRISGEAGSDIERTSLLYPVTRAESGAVGALADYSWRLGSHGLRVSIGYDEGQAKKDGLIAWSTHRPKALHDLVLQGPHISVANCFSKEPNIPCRSNRDWTPLEAAKLPFSFVPVANYARLGDGESFFVAQDLWFKSDGDMQRYTDFFRVAWRRMIPFDSERSLHAALIPPGPSHVHLLHSMAMADDRSTAMVAGFWASLPLDYMLRITGRANFGVSEVRVAPYPEPTHPLAEALLLRTVRLNCLTSAFADLWSSLYSEAWTEEGWAVNWPKILPLSVSVSDQEWSHDTPLRTEWERRAALVELDALVALWLGMDIDQLIAVYRSRYPILADYETRTWFDASGRKIAGNHNAYGYGQTKSHFEQLMAHLDPEAKGPVPDGYEAPFYKADREAEYRQAHAVFSERLRKAEEAGWSPEKGSAG